MALRSAALGATVPLSRADRAVLDGLVARGLMARSGDSYRLLPAGARRLGIPPLFLERAS